MCSWERIHSRDIERRRIFRCTQWQIFKEILPKCLGRCIADYTRRSVGFEIADTESVSPLAQDKKRLDRIVKRSSVFMADTTCIALRSKNQIQNVWFRFDLHFLFDFGSRRCVGLFSANCKIEINTKHNEDKG